MSERAILQRTAFFENHKLLGAKLVPFAGWEMPMEYGDVLAEARAVRSTSGIFDVSHMRRIFLQGPGAKDLLGWVFTNNVGNLVPGRARYTLLCNGRGGILDDAVFFRLAVDQYLLVANAANGEIVLAWLQRWATTFGSVDIIDRTNETAMIACQGPLAMDSLTTLFPKTDLPRPFHFKEMEYDGASVMVARTGYTGEDGFEAILEAANAPRLWSRLMELGAVPCGLGARDILRLEAGLPLHGNEIHPEVNPLEAGLERFVWWDKEFSGAEALRRVRDSGPARKMVGLRMMGKSLPKNGNEIQNTDGEKVGVITSGAYSPTLDANIALGYVSRGLAAVDTALLISVRGRLAKARVVALPFCSRRQTAG